jgi:hypothetical protein
MKRLILVPVLAAALLALLAAPALAGPKTFYVSPSGGNDTAAIQAAFKAAVKAGPGSIVQLTAGHFYTNTILVKGFNGTFKGAGEGQTVIDTPRALDPGARAINDPSFATTAFEPFAYLFGFNGGNVSVSDMSVDITADAPADPWTAHEEIGATNIQDIFLITGSANSAFDQVGFTAATSDDPNTGYNVGCDIAIQGNIVWDENPADEADGLYGNPLHVGPTAGSDRVTRCSFSGFIGVEAIGLTRGNLVVGGAAALGNAFNDYWAGCFFLDNSNSDFLVSHNQIAASGAHCVWCIQGWVANDSDLPNQLPPLPAPRFQISDNLIQTSGTASGVNLWDFTRLFESACRLDASITGNRFVLGTGPDTYGDGIGEFATQNIPCLDNSFSGSVQYGIYIGDDFNWYDNNNVLPVSGWQIIGNDLRQLSASVAPIDLGQGTNHCLVICPTTTGVLNLGVHNTLVNVTLLPGSNPSQAAARMAPSQRVTPPGQAMRRHAI